MIRALYAIATGWTMTAPPADKLRDACAHRFELDADGRPAVARLNMLLAS